MGYFLCAAVSMYCSPVGSPAITFWLPAGWYVAALLLNESRIWPWLILAAFPANLAFDLLYGTRLPLILCFYGVNTIQAVTGAWLVRRFVTKRPTLASLKEFMGFLAYSAGVSTIVGSTLGALTLVGFGLSHSFVQSWRIWWTGEVMAILLLSSFILTWAADSHAGVKAPPHRRKKLLEASLLVLLSLALTGHLLSLRHGITTAHRCALLIPLFWAGLRFGSRGAAAANLLLALPMAYLTTRFFIGVPQAQLVSGEYVFELQFSLAIASLVGLIPAIVLHSQGTAQTDSNWKTAFLMAQLDSALDGILVVDDRDKRILQNRRLFELFNVPEEIIKEDDDASLLRHVVNQTKHPKQFGERVAQLYNNPDEVGRDEIELADGRLFDRYSAPVRDKAGKYYGRIWTFRDITGHRKLELQLRQAQKMEAVGKLASGVAHDFNNILAVIQLQTDLILGEENLSQEHRESVQEIGQSAQRAANLTRQLLLFGRQQAMKLSDLDLNDSVVNITKMIRRVLGENIQMQFKYAPHPLFVKADGGMMDQVLMNLTVNARDAMPKGGHIFIETSLVEFDEAAVAQSPQSRVGAFACLSVSDTGCGIPQKNLPQIFTPFFSTKDVGHGTGLGLATVFGIVQQHQGWINVYSEVGHGTTFRIYLPCRSGVTCQTIAQKVMRPLRGGPETILLVEDDQNLRASMQKMLSKLGYHVLEAATGVSALKVWKHKRAEVDLLLTDLMMPDGMNGKDLAQRLLQENHKLKVIYVSGYSAEVAGRDFPLEEGVNFLPKPFETEKFAQTIRQCLDGGSPMAS